MFIVGILGWWYTTGWKQRFKALSERLLHTADYFSIDLLLKTLFAPYRQISAGQVRGPIGVQLRAFFDQLLSRIIGAIVRTFMIIAGLISMFVYLTVGLILVVAWGMVPLIPLVCLVLFFVGWLPWKL